MTDIVDPDAAGLLDGLTGDARAQRAELIPWLLEQGISVEEIRSAFAPMLLPSRRVLGDDGTRLSAREISGQAGLDIDLLMRFMRASGLSTVEDPDAAVYLRPDAETVVHIKRFLDLGFDQDQLLTVVRVLAEGLSRAAEAIRYTGVAMTMQHGGTTELEMAQGVRALVSDVAPLLGPMIQDMLTLQLRHAMETEAANANERAAGTLPGARLVAVAFADLVGFTRLGETVPPEELEQLANRLADAAREVAVAPVRFVKTIGDAVMLVSTNTAALLDAMLALVEATEADGALPQLRAGVAFGPAVSRAGDWFGSSVNLASRVTSASRPGTVLVAQGAREEVGDDPAFDWSFARARRLKGIQDDVKLFRARHAEKP